MRKTTTLSLLAAPVLFVGSTAVYNVRAQPGVPAEPAAGELSYPGEKHLANLRQLTFGGDNAEAYFSSDGRELIFQSTRGGLECDAIFRMNADGANVRRVSSGKGRTTCSFIAPDNKSHHLCLDASGRRRVPAQAGLFPGLRLADLQELRHLPRRPRRLATWCTLPTPPATTRRRPSAPTRRQIVFTSVRDGDLELYQMNADGSDVRRLTHTPGYDGGAFFTRDGSEIVWRASRPNGEELDEYRNLLTQRFGPATQPRNLHHEPQGAKTDPGHPQRRSQLRSLLAPGRPARHFRLEHGRSQGA